MSGFFERLGRFTTGHWKGVIVVYFAVSLLLLWKGSSIRLETSLAELLPESNRASRDFRDLLAEDGTLDRLLVSITLAPPSDDPAADLESLTAAAERVGTALQQEGLAVGYRYGVNEDDLAFISERAIDHLPVLLDAAGAGAIAERLRPEAVRSSVREIGRRARMPGFAGPIEEMAARDPLGLLQTLATPSARVEGFRPDPESGLFLSKDGGRLLLIVQAAEPPTEIAFSRRLVDGLQAAEADASREVAQGERLRFKHAGGHLFALEDERRIRHDAAATSAISIAGIALIYLFVIRRPALWLVVLLPLSLTTVWTLGLASIYPGRLNMITVAFAAILLGIGDDAMIHMYLRERHERREGLEAPRSVVAALAATGRAITVATLSSAAAFLALAFVQFRGLAELGIISAIGMLTLLFGVMFFFPAALTLLARRRRADQPGALRLPLGMLLRIHDWGSVRRRLVLGVVGAGTAAMLVAAMGLEISTDLRSIRGEDPAAGAMERLIRPFEGGAGEMMVVLHGPRLAGPPSPEEIDAALGEAERLRGWCASETAAGRLTGCNSPALIAPPRALQEERYRALSVLPWAEAVAALEDEARRLEMEPAFFAPFTRAVARYGDLDAVTIAPSAERPGATGMPRTRIWFRDQSRSAAIALGAREALGDPEARVASVALVSHDLGEIVASDFRMAAVLVAAAIALLSITAFRTVGVLVVTLVPVVLGSVWLLGTARLAGIELNLMSLMGMPVVFGLGVDYGVYVVDRWSSGDRDPRAALADVGPAVLVTGLTTLAGFAALLGAELAGLRSLGFAVVVGTGYTLAAALLILPLLLPKGSPHADREEDSLVLAGEPGSPAPGAARSIRG
jgi:predicted RND superfamily exporter protein